MKTKLGMAVFLVGTAVLSSAAQAAEKKYQSIFYSDEAEKYLEKWESNKAWSDAIVAADSLYKHQKYSAAAEQYEKALSQGYKEPQGIFNLAHCLDTLGQKEKASQYYLQAAKTLEARGLRQNSLFESYYRLGVLSGEKKDFSKALEYLEKARQIQSNNTDLLYSLGIVCQNLGRIDEAQKYYQAALGLDPKFEQARSALENLKERKNLPLDYSEILKRNHLPGKIPLEIVQLDSLGSKEINEKIGELEAKLLTEKGKDLGRFQYELGLYYATAKEYNKALEHIQKAQQLKYKPASSFLIGYIYYKTGETQKALAAYGEFVRKDPKDPLAHYNLAVLYDNQTQERDKAIHHYRRYIELAKASARDADDVGRRIWLLSNVRNP